MSLSTICPLFINQQRFLYILPVLKVSVSPIIEALYSGIPVVAATGSCLEEAGGPDSIYVNPDDITGLADAFKQIYSNSDKRKNMVEKGREFAKRFSEKQQSEEIINIYKKLIR